MVRFLDPLESLAGDWHSTRMESLGQGGGGGLEGSPAELPGPSREDTPLGPGTAEDASTEAETPCCVPVLLPSFLSFFCYARF